jgi:hypothetical protein
MHKERVRRGILIGELTLGMYPQDPLRLESLTTKGCKKVLVHMMGSTLCSAPEHYSLFSSQAGWLAAKSTCFHPCCAAAAAFKGWVLV